MLEVDGLGVSYGAVKALNEATFQVGLGEIVCLVGSNGAGKTSCLLGAMGLAVSRGRIRVDGDEIQAKPTKMRVAAGLALVPEGRRVFPELSVRENLSLGFRGGARDQRNSRFDEALEFFPRLRERIDQLAGSLSGGEQQMLALGRALMSGPRYLLLDEPTLGLAPVMVSRVAEVLTLLRRRGLGLLLAEQNLGMALSIADRGYVVAGGRITISGGAAELRDNAEVRKSYLGIV